ncbi:MAG: hypothetical protein OXG75_06005, partial [Candidatus Dadabacteria bacterium]|nr:hypothetical protein [Candidatus Dadabacteria bacterium]
MQKTQANEGDTVSLVFTLSGGADLDYPIAYRYSFSDKHTATTKTGFGGATNLDIQDPSSKTITIPVGDKKRTGTFTISDDMIDEPDEEFSIEISSQDSYSSNIRGRADIAFTITGTDMGGGNEIPVYLAGISGSGRRTQLILSEGSTATVEAMLPVRAPESVDIPITWRLLSGAATNDFTLPGRITIGKDSTSGSITLRTTDDSANENEYEGLLIELGDMLPDGFTEGDRSKLAVAIRDDDPIGISLRRLSARTISENNGEATFEVHLSRPLATEPNSIPDGFDGIQFTETDLRALLKYSPNGSNGAVQNADFTPSSPNPVNFIDCTNRQTCRVTVTAKEDNLHEGTEELEISIDENLSTSGTFSGDITEIEVRGNPLFLSIIDNDPTPTAITLSVDADTGTGGTQDSLAENGGAKTVRVTATLEGSSTFPEAKTVTVDVGKDDDSATEGVDYGDVTQKSITIDAGTSSGYVEFTIIPTDDTRHEANETISLGGTLTGLTVTDATITLTDNDAAPTTLTLTVDADTATDNTQTSIAEGGGAKTMRVTATLDGSTQFDEDKIITLAVGKDDDTATDGEDYATVTQRTIKIDAGASSGYVDFTLTPTNDNLHEGSETISLVGTLEGVTVTDTSVTLTDDDAAPTGITLSVDTNGDTAGTPSTVGEGAGATSVTVTATVNGVTRYKDAKTVIVSVADDTADSPADYAAVSDVTLTIAAGAASRSGTFTVTPVDDSLDEPDETIDVTGSSGSLTVTGTEVTITDNDDAPSFSVTGGEANEGDSITFTVTRAGAAGNAVSVDIATQADSGDGVKAADTDDYTALSSRTLSFAATETSKTVMVATAEDDLFEPDETFKAVLSSPAKAQDDPATGVTIESGKGSATGTIKNDDTQPSFSVADASASEGDTITFTVTRSGAMDNVVSVKWNTKADTGANAASTGDYTPVTTATTLSFAKGVETQTFTVATTEDVLDEANETFVVELTDAVGGTISDAEATGTITDDDATPTGITLSVDTNGDTAGTPSTVGEGAGATSVTVTATVNGVTRYKDAKTVIVSVADDTADSPADYAAVSDVTLTIAAGAASRSGTFTVTPVDDSLDEPDETIDVTGSSGSLTVTGTEVTITDNDDAPSFSVTGGEANEGDSITFTVTRAGAAGNAVSVDIATQADSGDGVKAADTDDYTALSSRTLSFAATETSKTVMVATAEDDLFEPDETFKAVLSSPAKAQDDPATGVTIESGKGSATGTIKNDDTQPSFSVADASASEGDTITFTVTRSGAMDNVVSVKWNTKADTGANAASTGDYTPVTTATTLSFAKGVETQTFTVATTEDVLDEANETFVVELTDAVGGTISDAEATGTITDDDATPTGITLTVSPATIGEADSE